MCLHRHGASCTQGTTRTGRETREHVRRPTADAAVTSMDYVTLRHWRRRFIHALIQHKWVSMFTTFTHISRTSITEGVAGSGGWVGGGGGVGGEDGPKNWWEVGG